MIQYYSSWIESPHFFRDTRVLDADAASKVSYKMSPNFKLVKFTKMNWLSKCKSKCWKTWIDRMIKEFYLKLESYRVCPKVGIKLCVDVDGWWLSCGILNDQEQLGDNLYHVTSLEDKITFPLYCLRWQAPGDVTLTPQLSGGRGLQK